MRLDFQSFIVKNLKTCPEKIENESYHNRRILRPILEDGNVNKDSFKMTFKRSESLCLVLKPLKNEQKRVPYSVFGVSSICLQYYLHFCFDSGAIANSCTTRLLSKSYEIPIDSNYPILQDNRNKVYRTAPKISKNF